MKEWKRLHTPLTDETVRGLRSGDSILLSGTLYTARDKAHERLRELADSGKPLPFNPAGQVIYYTGPTPARKGTAIGAAGPTTSYRMDPFSEFMLKLGIRGMIGKGTRDNRTRELLKEYGAVYFSSFGGAGAYLSKRIVSSSVLAFEDLGPEAMNMLMVKDFPVIVINDIYGGDLYEDAVREGRGLL